MVSDAEFEMISLNRAVSRNKSGFLWELTSEKTMSESSFAGQFIRP